MGSCVFNFDAKNEITGEIKADELWNKLKDLFKDHQLAKIYYGIATDERFLELVKDDLDFSDYDEQGHIKVEPLMRILDLKVDKEILRESIQKSIGKTPMDFSSAIYKIQAWNKLNENSSFLISFKEVGNGLVQLEVLDNTPKNKAKLIKNVQNRCITDRVMYYIRQAGGDVKFLQDGKESRFDSINAETNAMGLLELIQMSQENTENNLTQIRADLTEHAGLMILEILGRDNTLVKRLIDSIEKNGFIEEFLKRNPSFAEGRFNTTSDAAAIAGYMIGQLINNSVDKEIKMPNWIKTIGRHLSNLCSRIISLFKNKFKKVEVDKYKAALKEVQDNAVAIAQGFMSPEFNGTVKDLEGVKAIYQTDNIQQKTPLSLHMTLAKRVLDELTLLELRMFDVDKDMYKSLKKTLANVEGTIDFDALNSVDNMFMDSQAIQALLGGMNILTRNYTDIQQLLQQLNFASEDLFSSNMGKYAKIINTALLYNLTAVNILNALAPYLNSDTHTPASQILQSEITYTNKYGKQKTENLYHVIQRFKALLEGETTIVEDKPITYVGLHSKVKSALRSFVTRFISEIIGSNQIQRANRVLFLDKDNLPSAIKGETITMDNMLDNLASDLNWWERWFSSMSNNPDIVGQAFDKIVKVAKMNANRQFLNDRNQLLLLKQEALRRGVKIQNLYAYTSDKIPTGFLKGYIINKQNQKVGVDWGKWKDDFDEMVAKSKEDFKEKYGEQKLAGMRDVQRAMLWHGYFKQIYKDWHKKNSITTVVRNAQGKAIRYISEPNPEVYKSDDYKNLSEDEQWVLDRYVEWKAMVDSKLPQGATQTFRVPQMLGTTINQMRNRHLADESWGKAFLHTKMRDICDALTKNANDTDYGCDVTVNDSDPLYDKTTYKDEKYERIPLFFINLLPKEKRVLLSTDLFGSSISYSAMSNQYKQLALIKDALLVTQDQLKSRTIKVKGKVDTDNGLSNAYKRVTSYLDKELFGIQYHIRRSGIMLTLSKLIRMTTSLASRMFLGGNLQGAGANTIMGMSEVFKEAVVGEFFDRKSCKEAMDEYFGVTKALERIKEGTVPSLSDDLLRDSFNLIKKNKVNQFSEYFDVFGDSLRERYDFNTINIKGKDVELWKLKKADIFWNNCFMPYSAGDHFMQLIPFIALAKSTKLYFRNSKGEIEMTNAYDIYGTIKEDLEFKNGVFSGTPKEGRFGLIHGDNIKYAKDIKGVEKVENLSKTISDIDACIKELNEFVHSADSAMFVVPTFNKDTYRELLESKDAKDLDIKIVDDPNDLTNKDALLKLKDLKAKYSQLIHDLTWQIEDEAEFKMKGREIGNRLHGIYNMQDKVEALQNILGNMILAMRGYALGMVERRFGKSKYSLALGKDVEGSEITTLKVLLSYFKKDNGVTFSRMMAMQFLPLVRSQYVKDLMLELGFSDNQYYNMRRHQADWLGIWITSLFCGGLFTIFGWHGLLGRGASTDDDSDMSDADYLAALGYYFASRLYMESSAYNDILSFTKVEGPSVLSLMGSNVAMLSNMIDILQSYGQTYERGEFAGEDKGFVKTMKYVPYLRTWYILRDPRKAAQSFTINRGSNKG